MNNIDFNKFPNINRGYILFSLDEDVVMQLMKFPQTLARAQGSIIFAAAVGSNNKITDGVEPPNETRNRESNLRASLAEFVSMEEAIQRDLLNNGINKNTHKISDSSNPLLLVTRELRNFEIHLNSGTLSAKQKDFIWVLNGKEIPYAGNVWYLDNLNDSSLLQLKNAQFYDPNDLKRATNMFLNAQKNWGISQLMLRAVKMYCDEIIATYEL
ncbi:MAG: hypothetical protein WC799_22355 [Desulfobacteraceae bacterium]